MLRTTLLLIALVTIAVADDDHMGERNCVSRNGELITGGLYHVPNDCSKYFHCWQGLLYVSSCNEGEKFDKHLKECRPQDEVIC